MIKKNEIAEIQPRAAKIWVTSDLHLGHDREFIWRPRGFQSCAEMNEKILANLNEFVQTQDDLWILGDLTLGDLEKAKPLLARIPGHVHVVLGNHDTERRRAYYESLGWDCHIAYILKHNKCRFYLSHYPTITENLEEEYLTQAMINLYGHLHQQTNFYEDRPFCYHVGVDSHNCCPVDLDTIIQDIKNKITECKQYLD